VLIRLGRRILLAGASFFALLGFIAVPVGEQTGLEHVRGFLRSDTGKQVVSTSGEVGSATRRQVLKWLGGTALPETSEGGLLPPASTVGSEAGGPAVLPPDLASPKGEGTVKAPKKLPQAPVGEGKTVNRDGAAKVQKKLVQRPNGEGKSQKGADRTDQGKTVARRESDSDTATRVATHDPPKKKTRDLEDDDRSLNGNDFGRIIRIVQAIPNQRRAKITTRPKNKEREYRTTH
jgi:hypothetical protein